MCDPDGRAEVSDRKAAITSSRVSVEIAVSVETQCGLEGSALRVIATCGSDTDGSTGNNCVSQDS